MRQIDFNPTLVLFALWLMVFSASSQVIIISPILPRIGEALAIAPSLQGTLVTAYAVMLSLFALITGPISDKIGRRRILLLGTGCMFVALLFHGVADSYWSLLTMRGLAGAAGGMLSGGAVAYVADAFPYERRGWANGWVMSGIAFGQIIGIPLGTFLADLYGFRTPFLMFAATMGLAFALIWFKVPQPNVRRTEGRLTIGRAVRGYLDLAKKPEVLAACATYFLMFFSIGVYIIYLPTWLENTLNVEGTAIATLFLVGGIANVVTSPVAGKLSDQIGRKPLIIVSCVGLGIVMLATTYVMVSMWVAYIFFALAMVMVAMRISPLQSLVSALVAGDRRGILMSLAISIGQLGIGLGGALAGPAYTEYGYVSNTVLGAALILGMALIVYVALPEPKADAPAEEGADGGDGAAPRTPATAPAKAAPAVARD